MYTNSSVKVFHTNVEPKSSGNRVFENNECFDINALHRILNSGYPVIIRNHVGKWSEYTNYQDYTITSKLKPESGYVDTYMMSCYTRSSNGVVNRKIMLSFSAFGKNATLKATYYTS